MSPSPSPDDLGRQPWPHLLLDAWGCPSGLLADDSRLHAWCHRVIEVCGLRLLAGPWVAWGSDWAAYGPSAAALMHESHVSAHLCPTLGRGHFDVFSCKAVDEAAVRALIGELYAPARLEAREFPRG